jgi:short-subunit dehydrogenase
MRQHLFGHNYPAIDLDQARVVVTGAGRGIGRATATLFAEHGARVTIADIDESAGASAASAIGVESFPLDVRSKDQWDKLIAELGRIDILVNNAGVMPSGAFLDESDAITRATMDVNVWGLINGMRAAVPGMIDRGRGHVVNICSLAGKIALPGLATYHASKFAAVGLTAATRAEFAEFGISVSAVLPTAVHTQLSAGFDLAGIPAVEPEDVAAATVRTCDTRAAETVVPWYLSNLSTAVNFLPEAGYAAAIRLLGGKNRILKPSDSATRDRYHERVGSIAGPETS